MISVFVLYNLFILLKYGWLNSISASYYSLPDEYIKIKWNNNVVLTLPIKYNSLFLLFCLGYAIPTLFLVTDGFMFFACGLICFVGIASAFRLDSFTANMHQYSALGAVVLSQLSLIFFYHLYYLVIITAVSAVILYLLNKKLPQWMYILEWIAFWTVAIALL